MSGFVERKRLKLLDDHLYLSRNMVLDTHSKEFYNSFLNTLNVEDLSQYPDLWMTYDKLSNFLKIDFENLLITRGVEGAIKQAFDNIEFSKNAVGIITPTYAMYEVYAKAKGLEVKKTQGKPPDYHVSIDKIKEIVKQVDIFFLDNPKSHLPGYFENSVVDEILESCVANNCILFLDEVYSGWETQSYLKHRGVQDNLIISSGFSKVGFPCFKAGWLIAEKKMKRMLEANRSTYELNYFGCKGVEFIIDNYDYVMDFKQKLLDTKKDWVKKLSKSKKFKVYDSKNFVIRLYCEDTQWVKETVKRLKSKKIIVGVVDEVNIVFSVINNKTAEDKILELLSY